MSDTQLSGSAIPGVRTRALASPVVRILLGSLLVWLPAPLVTKTAHAFVSAPYAHGVGPFLT